MPGGDTKLDEGKMLDVTPMTGLGIELAPRSSFAVFFQVGVIPDRSCSPAEGRIWRE
jgi:hypothetical protein